MIFRNKICIGISLCFRDTRILFRYQVNKNSIVFSKIRVSTSTFFQRVQSKLLVVQEESLRIP